ncbi:hypothetical protein Ctha_1888 [Chloroherpeton thalassium ATCC 35110]|uniref:Short chain amide porin n=1 Tax=Chloroherpeton thalassium (strain ATCC 35110 / GB-78) TaxID=517418 RepID=B3QU96_CHLT3|nr:hypothetical protein [Chloroherpeton thalassium]ACF14345.1 hypothetical protein Ctha_1888 [Chloroherpeton thalassium ATCC 35110]
MKKVLTLIVALAALFSFGSLQAKAQGSDAYKPLKVTISDDSYIRFITWHQVYGTYNDNTESFNMTLRRSRFLAYAELQKKFLIVTHFGINSQTASSAKKPGLFMHDAWVQYHVFQNDAFHLDFGAGLHYWNGISRMTMASTLNFLEIDAPIFNWPNVDKNDQFARQLGYYVKGTLDKIHYSFSAVEPFVQAAPTLSTTAALNNTVKWAYNGYVEYQFGDEESTTLPYRVGSYLGTKSVFNIGAGFYFHPTGSIIDSDADGVGETVDQFIFAVDAFFDQPIGGDMALTAYGVFYSMDYGDGYLRGTSGGTLYGTGSIFFAQAGLLLPKDIIGDAGKLQPYVGFSYRDLDATDDAATQLDLGINWFLSGHHARVAFEYSNVPMQDATDAKKVDSYNQFRFLTSIYL